MIIEIISNSYCFRKSVYIRTSISAHKSDSQNLFIFFFGGSRPMYKTALFTQMSPQKHEEFTLTVVALLDRYPVLCSTYLLLVFLSFFVVT